MTAVKVNTELLETYIKKSGFLIGYICEQLGVSRQAFARKRLGETQFRASEIYVLCDMLKIPEDDKQKIFLLKQLH